MSTSFGKPRPGKLQRVVASGRKVFQRLPSHLDLQRCSFNGAGDIIYVFHDGYFSCTGWYLSISRLSSVRYRGRDSDIKIKINDKEVGDFRINLNKISRHAGKNDVGVPVYTPTDQENKLIFNLLRPGRNKITFYIEDRPNSSIDARIFLWERDSKVIVVDIDGTITRSELRGLLHCYTEEHYLHPDVPKFFLYLEDLGYRIIYLTARPISTVNSTRKYLVDDYDKFLRKQYKKLPDGPVFTSCDGRIRTTVSYVRVAFNLGGTTHYSFKVNFLMKVQESFFVEGYLDNPLYAGFGNTDADKSSYCDVFIPDGRIFRITKEGEIILDSYRFTSYDDLLDKCRSNFIFPRVRSDPGSF